MKSHCPKCRRPVPGGPSSRHYAPRWCSVCLARRYAVLRARAGLPPVAAPPVQLPLFRG